MTKSERDKLRLLNQTPEQKVARNIAAVIRCRERRLRLKQESSEPHMADGNPWVRLDSILRRFALESVRLENNSFVSPVVNTDKQY